MDPELMNDLRNAVACIAVAVSALASSEARADDGPLAPVASSVVVVPVALPDPPETHVRSKADIAVGSVLMGLGVAHIVPGAWFLGQHDGGFIDVNGFAGAMFIGFGVAHVIPGIVLIAVGASQVTEKPTAAVHAEVEIAPSGADFALHF